MIWKEAGNNKKLTAIAFENKSELNTDINLIYELFDLEGISIGELRLVYSIYSSGDIRIDYKLNISGDNLPEIPRIGLNWVLPSAYDNFEWFGRGPFESYWDRKTSALVGYYKAKVIDQYVPYIRPQENGNKTDVRWLALSDTQGNGILVQAGDLLSVSAHNFLLEDFESLERTDGRHVNGVRVVNRHTTDVKARDLVSLNIDFKQMGVGGDNSWGARTHPEYTLTDKQYSYSFTIRPFSGREKASKIARLRLE